MRNTFLNRVSAERRVLSVINSRLKKNQQLTGLSMVAISRWSSVIGLDRSSTVNRLLIALAENCQRLSDRSNETFTPISKTDSEQIESQLLDLEREHLYHIY